jgi:dTDP-glucose 4,6-dehydratase
MHVLVTGGAGFIGSNFVRHLIDETGHSVTTVDALTYAGDRANLRGVEGSDRHRFVEGDVCDPDLVDGLVAEADAVVNFAAESHVDRSIDGAAAFVATNVGGAQRLLAAAVERDLDRFVQISTDEVYGEILEGRATEESRLGPRNPYAATKAGADLLCRSYHVTHDLPVLVVRASNNYGPRQHREKLIPKLLTRAAAGESLPLYGDGTNVREWMYVEDTCRAIRTVLEDGAPGEIYNVGSGEERENVAVARTVLDLVGAPEDLIEFVPDRPGHDARYALDASKVEALGWRPTVGFEEGIERTARFYLDGGGDA